MKLASVLLLAALVACESSVEPTKLDTKPNFVLGPWVWGTGFETDQPMNPNWSHPGSIVQRTTAKAFRSTWSLQLTTPAEQYKRASVVKSLPFTEGVHAAEFYFLIPVTSKNNVAMESALEGWSGTTEHFASIHWVSDSAFNIHGWRYWVDCPTCSPWTGKWEFIPGGQGVLITYGSWHRVLVEVDYATRTYTQLTVQNMGNGSTQVYNLGGRVYDVNPRTTDGSSYQLSLLAWTQQPVAKTVYVDSVRTQ